MIKLVNTDMKEFKTIIYPEYLKLFPESERKTYKDLEKSFKNNILRIIKIIDEENFIGFMMVNTLKKNRYLQLDYFAILPQYQSKGYGKKALKILKNISRGYNGIFIEVEKVGLAGNEDENRIRLKRVKFYERLGFRKLRFDLELYKVIYSPYILQISDSKEDEEKIMSDIFEIYKAILGEKRVKENCKIII